MNRALLRGILDETGLRIAIHYQDGRRLAAVGPLAQLLERIDLLFEDGRVMSPENLRGVGVVTALVAPISLDGVTLGVLVAGDTDERRVDPSWRAILEDAAETLAAAGLYRRSRALDRPPDGTTVWVDALLAAEKRLLELVARGGRLDAILESLCRFFEEQSHEARCSIMLATEQTLYTGAAPSLPVGLIEAFAKGLPVGMTSGSCGASASRGERVIVRDVASDATFGPDHRALVLAHGIRACWSTPIKAAAGDMLGTFAVYYDEPREPDGREVELLDRLVHIAGIAIERQRVADALLESEQRYRTVVDSLNEVIFQTDLDGRLTFLSASFAVVTGRPLGESLGRKLASFVHSDDRARFLEVLAPVLAGDERACRQELRVLARDGSHRWIDLHARPTHGSSGVVGGVSGIFTDVTERKQLEAHLMVSDRMASMGTLVAGVAHEINNPLASVMLNLDYIGREVGAASSSRPGMMAPDRLIEPLRAAAEGAERVREIVRNLKIFSRGDERRRPVDLHHVLDSTIRMAQNELRHRGRLVREYGDVPLVEANEANLGQVFLNLIVNAAQAIREGHADVNEIRVTTYTDLARRAVVEVRDTGVGIPPDVMSRVFDPFFTTKPIGVGTGLGLSICHRLVTSLGGEISVESEVGVGSLFRVRLPGAPHAQLPRRSGSSPVKAVRRARILVVDDEPMVGDAVQRMFAPLHSVIVAGSGDEALRRVASGERYDVILCDVMMPEMTGMQLHDELSRLYPELASRMVFITGGAFTPWAKTFLERVPNPVLEKPFDTKALAAMINERLR